jgi:hypothetical protein
VATFGIFELGVGRTLSDRFLYLDGQGLSCLAGDGGIEGEGGGAAALFEVRGDGLSGEEDGGLGGFAAIGQLEGKSAESEVAGNRCPSPWRR